MKFLPLSANTFDKPQGTEYIYLLRLTNIENFTGRNQTKLCLQDEKSKPSQTSFIHQLS